MHIFPKIEGPRYMYVPPSLAAGVPHEVIRLQKRFCKCVLKSKSLLVIC